MLQNNANQNCVVLYGSGMQYLFLRYGASGQRIVVSTGARKSGVK